MAYKYKYQQYQIIKYLEKISSASNKAKAQNKRWQKTAENIAAEKRKAKYQ